MVGVVGTASVEVDPEAVVVDRVCTVVSDHPLLYCQRNFAPLAGIGFVLEPIDPLDASLLAEWHFDLSVHEVCYQLS